MSSQQITMIDYGASNLRSAQKAFEFVGASVKVTHDPAEVARAVKLVLPGVGAFGAGMKALHQRGLVEPVIAAAKAGVPLLGICLGMQFLFDESDEMGHHAGLGLIPGKATRFGQMVSAAGEPRPLKVPHMGWNQIEHDGRHPLLANVASGAHGYFVHSYYCAPDLPADTIAQTEYGIRFTSIVGRDNILGIQFHPEKSQNVGLQIIRNFMESF